MDHSHDHSEDLICFGRPFYLLNKNCKYLFSRGYINPFLYFSSKISPECLFTFEQKQRLATHSSNLKQTVAYVVFGTEVLIKNEFSQSYVGLDKSHTLCLKPKEDSTCYFELLPQRTFEHQGDYLHLNSLFQLHNTFQKAYLTSLPPQLLLFGSKSGKIKESRHILFDPDRSPNKRPIKNAPSIIDSRLQDNVQSWIGRPGSDRSQLSASRGSQMTEEDSQPLFAPEEERPRCCLEKHGESTWKLQVKEEETGYLLEDDYVYFVSSDKTKGLLSVDARKKEHQYIRKHQNETYLAAVFVVQKNENNVYLRHLLSGKYFPFNPSNSPKRLTLHPLTAHSAHQLPPFHLLFDDQFFPKSERLDTRQLHGFWLNKIEKQQIKQILSLQGVPSDIWLPYLNNYLTRNAKTRQNILHQFQFLRHIIFQEIPSLKRLSGKASKERLKSCYRLIFNICKLNKDIKSECVEYLSQLLKEEQKQIIVQIFSELLDSHNGFVQKYIAPRVVYYLLVDFIQQQLYSVAHMRLFRLFCGPNEQPCLRNQQILAAKFGNVHSSLSQLSDQQWGRLTMPPQFSFTFAKEEAEVYFSNGETKLKFKDHTQEVREFIRQYVYLMGDTIKKNSRLIQSFQQKYPFSLLLHMLCDEGHEELRGPILNLVVTGYMEPDRVYRLFVFYPNSEQMCFKGHLVALNRAPHAGALLQFIRKQVETNKDYRSTKFKHLLRMIKMSVLNGYWSSMAELLTIIDALRDLHTQKNVSSTLQNYDDISHESNLTHCKIKAVSITLLLLDLQINLWITELLGDHLTEPEEVDSAIDALLAQSPRWKISQANFSLCATDNFLLMRNSLLLFQRLYNLRSILATQYQKALAEHFLPSPLKNVELEKVVQFSTRLNEPSIYRIFLEACVVGYRYEQIEERTLIDSQNSLQPVFKYHQANAEMQNLASKLGIVRRLCGEISRYVSMRKKERANDEKFIGERMLLLLALVRRNHSLTNEITHMRRSFVRLLEQNTLIYYIALDLLQEIYRDNRPFIISDAEELELICTQIRRTTRMHAKHSESSAMIKTCKLIHFLGVFLQTAGRPIKDHHLLLLRELFSSEALLQLIPPPQRFSQESIDRSDQKQTYNLYEMLLNWLLLRLEQDPKKMGLGRLAVDSYCDVILVIGRENWGLKMKLFSLLSENLNAWSGESYSNLLLIIKSNLTTICELLLKLQFCKEYPFEVQAIASEFHVLVNTIARIFSITNLAVQKSKFRKLMIIERLFLLRSICSTDTFKTVETLWSEMESSFPNVSNMRAITISHFTVEDLRDQKSLLVIYESKPTVSLLPQIWRQIFQVYQQKQARQQQLGEFRVEQSWLQELKGFTRSLIQVNKTDSTALSDELKQFFVTFLIDTFLKQPNAVRLMEIQNKLVSYEIPSMLASFLSEQFSERYELFNEVLLLGIHLLEGGNEVCQQSFLSKFKQDGGNCIFDNLHQYIQHSFVILQFYFENQDPQSHSNALQSYIVQRRIKREKQNASKLLSRAFRFLQLLCENDNHEMKSYVFSQTAENGTIKYLSLNFLEIADNVLDRLFDLIIHNLEQLLINISLQTEIKDNLLCLPEPILNFLIEVCQLPAFENQAYLCKTDFFGIVDRLKRLHTLGDEIKKNHGVSIFGHIERKDQVGDILFVIERKIVILYRSLLEEQNPQIIEIMGKKVENQHLQFFILESFVAGGLTDQDKLQLLLQSYQLSPCLQNVVDVLIIKKSLQRDDLLTLSPEKSSLLRKLDGRLRSIEVNFKGKLTTVYFSFHPLFQLLSKATKQFFVDKSVTFSSRNEKLRDLIVSRKVIYQDIENEKQAPDRIMSHQAVDRMFFATLALAYIIIFLLVLFYSVTRVGTVLDALESQIIRSLSLMQMLMAIIYLVIWGINLAPLARQKLLTRELFNSLSPKAPPKVKSLRGQLLAWEKLVKQIYLDDSSSLHAVMLVLVSLAAVLIQVRLNSLMLLFIFAKLEVLESIWNSILLTWKQLFVVCILAVAFSFIFGFLSINHYVGTLYENQEVDIGLQHRRGHCHTILGCIDSLYTQKLIGETSTRDSNHYGRFVSDVVHWSFFQIFLTNIIAAIIIDKFAEQRHIREKVEHHKNNCCFICSAQRAQLERRRVNFSQHVEHIHNLWDYFFYMYYLERLKPITEFTGIEYWIGQQIREGLTEWIPAHETVHETVRQSNEPPEDYAHV